MRRFDGVVHFASGAEIIRRDDQSLQAASRRARKNWKNSTPSRKRRFIISGLTIISATMDAIFEGLEFLVEILDRIENFAVAEMGIVQRRDLRAFLRQEVDLLIVEPTILLGLTVEEGARIWRR